jgi:hypothetical protein
LANFAESIEWTLVTWIWGGEAPTQLSYTFSVNEQCFSLTTNQRTVFSAMTFHTSEQGHRAGALNLVEPKYPAASAKQRQPDSS